ncbi:MAG: protein kinase, partial [Erysipelotrichaceae bacterium]
MNVINNRYEIIKNIGEGGMANVYLAKDLLLDREVAIKILRGELANDQTALLRFQREANASSTLSHPNIVEIYDVGHEGNKNYIVMEYIKGVTLKQLISKRGTVQLDEAISIMKQLCSAIKQAHEHNIIHRDIKPQNVLITADNTIKITDFGIAMAQDALQLTSSDTVMGSVHYLAPELAKGELATAQSDIYSLGIVLYELLRGDV